MVLTAFLRDHDSYFFKSSSAPYGGLSLLNNLMGMYAKEIDSNGKGIAKI
jgi:hypothetical protein